MVFFAAVLPQLVDRGAGDAPVQNAGAGAGGLVINGLGVRLAFTGRKD